MKVLIIGGGIAGLTIAREFFKKGIEEICLMDRRSIGQEASFTAAGMLAPQAESKSDGAFFRYCLKAREFYPDFAEDLLDETGIDIELEKSGTLFVAFDEKDEIDLADRFAWQSSAGLEIERLSARETHRLEPFVSPDSISSLMFPNDWQVENRKLLKALTAYSQKNGIRIMENSKVTDLDTNGDKISGVTTETGERVEADIVILATGAWASDIKAGHDSVRIPEITPVRGQITGYKTAKRLISHVIYSHRGYLVPRKDGRVLTGSTTEEVGFEDVVTREGLDLIRRNTLEIIPSFANLTVVDSWSGLRPRSPDGLPVIGSIDAVRNLYVATGYYRNGILLGPLSAKILAEQVIDKKRNPLIEKLSPNRFSATAK